MSFIRLNAIQFHSSAKRKTMTASLRVNLDHVISYESGRPEDLELVKKSHPNYLGPVSVLHCSSMQAQYFDYTYPVDKQTGVVKTYRTNPSSCRILVTETAEDIDRLVGVAPEVIPEEV